jgi:class 3 adenylate cyclase
MLQVVAAVLCVVFGALVVALGQDRRVKPWFALLCLSCAVLALGHLVETTSLRHTLLAARIVMAAAVVAALAGAMSAQIMCGMRPHRPLWIAVVVAGLLNVVTVLLTDWYFTGQVIHYRWGFFVAGRLQFVANPLSVSAIVLYAFVGLLLHHRKAHPLDRNRIGFFLVAYSLLALTLLDYLPHFGVDLLGGLASGVFIPLFLAAFGYASLRYRLLELRLFLARAAGYLVVTVLAAAIYAMVVELGHRLGAAPARAALVAAAAALGTFALFGRLLPRLLEQFARRKEPDYEHVLEALSSDLMTHRDEGLLFEKTREVCLNAFHCSSAELLDAGAVAADEPLARLARSGPVVEVEVARRQGAAAGPPGAELLVPLTHDDRLLGVLALGGRVDGRLYTRVALRGFHTLGNLLSLALTGARSAAELEKRQRLDRYLAPQIVESVLHGGAEAIERQRRAPLTVFFSDLKDFTKMSDGTSPERLAQVLNEYLSEMAEIAFAHGGTLDKFMGDAVMVFFGAPMGGDAAREARECLRMAVAMQRRLQELNREWLERGLVAQALSCRIGVHTGEAIVGSFGSRSRLDYTAIGSTVNLASRLEGQCAPDRILVSDATAALLDEGFAPAARGEVMVKGFSRPVRVFEIDPGVTPAA